MDVSGTLEPSFTSLHMILIIIFIFSKLMGNGPNSILEIINLVWDA